MNVTGHFPMTLIYHPAGYKSAKRLADALDVPALHHTEASNFTGGPLLRWGSYRKVPIKPTLEINSRSSLRAYRNRFEQLLILAQSGVIVPWFTSDYDTVVDYCRSPAEIKKFLMRDFPEDRQNTGGKGITIHNDIHSVPPHGHDMYMAFVPKYRQFRVHITVDATRTREVIHESEVILNSSGHIESFTPDSELRNSIPVWNLSTGFIYRYVQGERPNGVISQAKKAVAALSLDFGAVDVIVDPNMTPFVLEVNTAPALAGPTLAWYATRFSPLLQGA